VIVDSLELLVVILNHIVVECDLLLEANERMAQIGVPRCGRETLGMLGCGCAH
jgi:hypothetical protein